jgi:hypothetical protein
MVRKVALHVTRSCWSPEYFLVPSFGAEFSLHLFTRSVFHRGLVL